MHGNADREPPVAEERLLSPRPRRWLPRVAITIAVSTALGLSITACGAGQYDHGNRPTSSPTQSAPSTLKPAESLAPATDHGAAANAEGSAISLGPGRYDYTVAASDTVFGIASRFGVCLADLFGSNRGLAPNEAALSVGQKLKVARVEGPDHEASECLVGGSALSDYP